MARLILDRQGDGTFECTDLDTGVTTSYATWVLLIAAIDLADIEIDNFGSAKYAAAQSDNSNGRFRIIPGGTAPLTAQPTQGATVRAAGQGCTNCAYQVGCLKIAQIRHALSTRHGIKCGSYSAAS